MEKAKTFVLLGKDNIPFHTVIWPAIIMGLNHANKGLDDSTPLLFPGDLNLEDNVPAMEYLMYQVDNSQNLVNTLFGYHHS